MELLVCLHTPKLLSCFEFKTVQGTFGPKCVNTALSNRRSSPRPFVESEIVPVIRRICELPDLLSISRIQTFDNFLVRDPVEEDESAFGNHGRTEPFPRVHL